MASSTWTAALEDVNGNVLSFATTIQALTLTVPLNAPAEVSTAFDLDGNDASAILNQAKLGGTILRLMENGTSRFYGVLTDLQVEVNETSQLTARFVDAAGHYANIFTFALVSGTSYRPMRFPRKGSTTVAAIVDDLIAIGSPLVPLVRSGSVTGSKALAPEGASVLDVFNQLTEAGWMEWYVTPYSAPGFGTLNIASKHGDLLAANRIVFGTGKDGVSNIVSATVQFQPPKNRVFVQSDNQQVAQGATDAASIADYGEYADMIQNQTRGASTDSDVAYEALRWDWQRIAEIVLEPTVCPRPWTDFNLGDTASLTLDREGLTFESLQRINQFEVVLNDSLIEESINVTFELLGW